MRRCTGRQRSTLCPVPAEADHNRVRNPRIAPRPVRPRWCPVPTLRLTVLWGEIGLIHAPGDTTLPHAVLQLITGLVHARGDLLSSTPTLFPTRCTTRHPSVPAAYPSPPALWTPTFN